MAPLSSLYNHWAEGVIGIPADVKQRVDALRKKAGL
jgi:hypothetical protein